MTAGFDLHKPEELSAAETISTYITYIPLAQKVHYTHDMLCPSAFGAWGKCARSDGVRVSQHFLNVFILPSFAASTYTTEQLPASGTQVIYSSGPGVLHRHFQGLFLCCCHSLACV